MADGVDSNNFWSWVDASFMAMNTWARMGAATGEAKYPPSTD
jgi:rhamnogalacturonyl hydrolase YesR